MALISPPTTAGRCRAWLLAAGLAAGLASSAAFAVAPPAGNAVAAYERDGRAQPKQAAADLGRLLEGGTLDGPTRLEALTVQGVLLAGIRSDEAAEAVARQLDEWAQKDNLPAAEAAALLVRARLAEQLGDIRRASKLIADAAVRLPANAPPAARLRVIGAQAHIQTSAGKLEDAIRSSHEALKLADALGEPWRQSEMRTELAYSYYLARQIERANSLADEAMKIARVDGDSMTLAHANTVHGIVRGESGDTAGEKRAMQAALAHARKAGAKYEESLYLANLADFYLKNAEYSTALEYAQQALPLTRELKNLNGETVALANTGLAQIALGDIEAGKRNLRASADIDERRGSITGVSDTYREMGQYLEKAGDLRGAVEALHQHRALSDQILQRGQQQAILEMQEQFDADRRTRELELLHREGEIKSEQLRAHDLQQGLWWLLAAGGVLTFIIVVLLLRRVRQTNHQLADSNARLKVQAEIDPLTGLANRRHFQAAMRQLAADGKLAGTVFLIDIDHFKRINDRWGHAVGDAVLVEVARRLRATLREPDLIVRWGGEEFLVVVRALAPEAVDALAQRMLDVVGTTPVQHDGRVIGTTVSIGYATFPIEPTLLAVSWERAINLVDTALYLAKGHGRNRAYGVRTLPADDEAQFDVALKSLEAAWRSGDVTLMSLQGPADAERVGVAESAPVPLAVAA